MNMTASIPPKYYRKKEFRKGRWVWRFYVTENQEITDFFSEDGEDEKE